MTIHFCRTEHHYRPYDDWYRLAELSGYEVIPISQMDVLNPDHVYIVNHFGALGMPGNEHEAKARIILWQLEWAKVEDKGEYPPNIREIWASDKWYADYYGARYTLLGSHEGLVDTPPNRNGAKEYDVCLMMYREPYRRRYLINRMIDAGITIAPDGWDEERDRILNSSRCMLHIHQHDDIATVAPLRFALAAAYKLPLITETCKDKDNLYEFVPEYDYSRLLTSTQNNLNWNGLAESGEWFHSSLCHVHPFRRSVEEML